MIPAREIAIPADDVSSGVQASRDGDLRIWELDRPYTVSVGEHATDPAVAARVAAHDLSVRIDVGADAHPAVGQGTRNVE